MKKTNPNKIIKNHYHPGNLTTDTGGFKQDEQAPNSERIVEGNKTILYDYNDKPLSRRIGF